jgi:hypothetical protein
MLGEAWSKDPRRMPSTRCCHRFQRASVVPESDPCCIRRLKPDLIQRKLKSKTSDKVDR